MRELTIVVNGETQQCAAQSTVQQLLEALGYNCSEIALAINQDFVPRSEYASTIVSSDDELDVVAAVQGG